MDIINHKTLEDLINERSENAVSIYMPTFPVGRETQQNPIRLRNLVRDVEGRLRKRGFGAAEATQYLQPLTALVEDESFWMEQDQGLALFLSPEHLTVLHLPERLEEIAVVGPRFYITPLIPIAHGQGQFFLLALNQKKPRLYYGTKYQLAEWEDVTFPEYTDKDDPHYVNVQVHNQTRSPNTDLVDGREGVFFGHGGKEQNENEIIRQYFRDVDGALKEILAGSEIPLVLAGVEMLHPLYADANTYQHLMEEGIARNVELVPMDELQAAGWEIVDHRFEVDTRQALGNYQRIASDDGPVSTDVEEIISAAKYKRIQTLFLAQDARLWGYFNWASNDVRLDQTRGEESQDLLNYAAGETLINGGEVIVLPPDRIPEGGKAAAIMRY